MKKQNRTHTTTDNAKKSVPVNFVLIDDDFRSLFQETHETHSHVE